MISIVIPCFNEEANITPLYDELSAVLIQLKTKYEIIFVNDGSLDATQTVINRLSEKDTHVYGIQLQRQYGKASALHAGFQKATGGIVITLDADMQDDPHEIPKMIAKLNEGYDLVSGWKQNRKDSFIKNNTSKIFNYFTGFISPVKLHDFNCGFKIYRQEVAKELTIYGELHRYIPVLAAALGYRVTEIPVNHRLRHAGLSKYGGIRFINGFLDLFTVLYITKFHNRPLHFFGYIGLIFFGLGFLVALYLTYVKFNFHESIGERPLLLFSVMLMIMGVQISVTGLVGEQITRSLEENKPHYKIRDIIGKK